MKACREDARLVDLTAVSADCIRLGFDSPEVASKARPGQFVMLGPLAEDSLDPFLNRPYSIHRQPQSGRIELLVARVGRGSQALAELEVGAQVPLLGPLGRGFSWTAPPAQALLLGGGVGVAPLFFLAETLASQGVKVCLVQGAATAARLVSTEELSRSGVEVIVYTDDGSAGLRGLATEGIERCFDERKLDPKLLYMASCGPTPMLRAFAAWAERQGLSAQLSLENHMACGTGACMGCSLIMGKDAKRVCVEGPVFDLEEVVL
ncbi:MAG: dihydroorotate dehydrogenase electron transfer subunit [Deltaproteobacteria bacterium]|nr:dihydroorotate dehydrogenase electron transfer subunit [Deltaproteobacteria bacterium]